MDNYLPSHRHISIYIDEVCETPGFLYELMRLKIATQYLDYEGILGWQLVDSEYDEGDRDFLLFVEFVFGDFDEHWSVTVIFRSHDLYNVGHLDRNRHAFLLEQEREEQLYRTESCLNYYNIPHSIMEDLGDSYPAMEAVAEIRRAHIMIGQDELRFVLTCLDVENPLANLQNTGYSYLFLSMFICEGRRILTIRDAIVNNFNEIGATIPEVLLQYLYGWGVVSYILAAWASGNEGPLNYYSVMSSFGRMGFAEMAMTYDLIKQALEPRADEIIIDEVYQRTVDQFNRFMYGQWPEDP